MAAAPGAPPAERPLTGLTLHRSEVIAHSLELLEKAGSTKASIRARGREEGFACAVKGASPSFVPVILVPAYPFRPLGTPMELQSLSVMNSRKLAQVEQMRQALSGNEQEPRARDREAERAAAEPGHAADGQDGELEPYSEPQGTELDQEGRLQLRSSSMAPQSRGGRDLHNYEVHRHTLDGFAQLKKDILESKDRVQQVKVDAPGAGLGHMATQAGGLLPPRERYPSARGACVPPSSSGSADTARGGRRAAQERVLTGPSGSLSARAPARPHHQPPLPGEPPGIGAPRLPPGRGGRGHARESPPLQDRRKGALSLRLPSLADFVAHPGQPASGRAERREMALEREVTNQLLQLPKETTLDLLRSTRPPGRQDFRRHVEQLEQDFESSRRRGLRERQDFERTVEQQKSDPPPRGRAAAAHKDETSRLYRERAQEAQDLLDDVEGFADGQEGGQGAGDKRGSEADGSASAPLASVRRRRAAKGKLDQSRFISSPAVPSAQDLEGDESGRAGDGVSTEWVQKDVLDKALRVHKLQAKVSESSRRADEKREDLQLALATYQASRDSNRDHLLESLRLMDDDRPNRVRRRLKLESASAATRGGGGEDRVRRQVELHRELLQRAQSDKGPLDGVVHWMLDSLKHVLECGEEFRKETFFAMLERIEDCEFSRLVSAIVVKMAEGIDVTPEELVARFQQDRGAVPPRVRELLEGDAAHVRALLASPGRRSPQSPGSRAPRFFVTEQE